MNNNDNYEGLRITRKQLLFRFAIFMLSAAVIFAVITFFKLTNYLNTPVFDYEAVEAEVVEYKEKSSGIEGFPKKPYEVERYATVRYENYESRYALTDSLECGI